MKRILRVLILVLVATDARAQTDGGNIDLQTFRPAMDSRGFVTVNSSEPLGHRQLSFGLVTSWGKGLARLDGPSSSYSVDHLVTPTLVAAYGLAFGPLRLELGAAAPFAIVSGDRGPDSDGGTPADPNDDERFGFSGQGLGDISLSTKIRLARQDIAGVGAALVASVSLPTASEDAVWIGDGAVVPQVVAVVDRRLGDFRVGASAGFRFRSDEEFRDDGSGPNVPFTGQVIGVGSTIPFGAALSYAIVDGKFDVVGELFGALPLAGENYLPVEALGGIKVYLAKSSFLTAGAGGGLTTESGSPDVRAFLGIVFEPVSGDRDGDGIRDDDDACPDDPEDFDDFQDRDGCPEPDNDRDRILDKDDQCPNDPEDYDGFDDEDGCPDREESDRDGDKFIDDEDACPDDPEDYDDFKDKDGCPEPDNDNDKILDVDDLCPLVPENRNGFEDDDGCPDRKLIELTKTTIDILEEIQFEFDSAVIKSESFPILDAIVATLVENTDILRVEVQGHTDERGSDRYNLSLSQRRADSVVVYLMEKGIDLNRLVAKGFGESDPKVSGTGEAAWKANRRVEFHIHDRRK